MQKEIEIIMHGNTASLKKETELPPFNYRHTKSNLLESLNERLKELQAAKIKYLDSLSSIGEKISKGSAATGRSNTKKEKLLCLLLIDLIEQIPTDTILLSDKADEGFLKLVEPVIRKKN